jgi:hypothetical protein
VFETAFPDSGDINESEECRLFSSKRYSLLAGFG